MAGTAESGWAAGSAALFDGAAWVVAADDGLDLDVWRDVAELAWACGAGWCRPAADEHDLAVARVSHLPHLLGGRARRRRRGRRGRPAPRPGRGSFADGTRVAGTRPELVLAMCEGNRDALLAAVDDALGRLGACGRARVHGASPPRCGPGTGRAALGRARDPQLGRARDRTGPPGPAARIGRRGADAVLAGPSPAGLRRSRRGAAGVAEPGQAGVVLDDAVAVGRRARWRVVQANPTVARAVPAQRRHRAVPLLHQLDLQVGQPGQHHRQGVVPGLRCRPSRRIGRVLNSG
jgi:hypothetical protein